MRNSNEATKNGDKITSLCMGLLRNHDLILNDQHWFLVIKFKMRVLMLKATLLTQRRWYSIECNRIIVDDF